MARKRHSESAKNAISKSMLGNRNAEIWDEKAALELFEKALELSYNSDYDFIGEIAFELRTYIEIFDHLIDRFPELAEIKKHIKRNCERNCYSNTKKGNINTAAGIINLKSNHNWTDRAQIDQTTNGKDINKVDYSTWTTEQLERHGKALLTIQQNESILSGIVPEKIIPPDSSI